MMNRVLLVEDDALIADSLGEFLRCEGFCVETAAGQSEAVAVIDKNDTDILLVDITLSEGNGFAVCACAKQKGLPVIFLTASGDEYSVITGLDMGADDYVSKPFRPRELVSRIKSVLRRAGKASRTVALGEVTVDTEKGVVTRDGQDLYLSALEYRLLLELVNNRGAVMSRARLLENIWDAAGDFISDNALSVYIRRLREKIERDPQTPEIIKTVRGIGYRIDI